MEQKTSAYASTLEMELMHEAEKQGAMHHFSSIKETSMASVLPVIELTKLGNQIYAKTYHPFEIYISLGVLYFVMTYSMTFVARKLERKATKWQ